MTSFQKYTVFIGQVSSRWRPRIAHSHTHNCEKRQSGGGWVAKWLNSAEPLNKLLHWIYVIDLYFDLSVTPKMFKINVYIKILSFPYGLLLFYNGIEYFVRCNFQPARFSVGDKKLKYSLGLLWEGSGVFWKQTASPFVSAEQNILEQCFYAIPVMHGPFQYH